jgi:SAM-dependent methyltransferase
VSQKDEPSRTGGCESPATGATGNYTMAHNFNSALFRVLLDYLKPGPGERIIDLGCSRGFYVRAMEQCTEAVVGVDISEAALREAVTPRVEYGDITALKFATASFDKAYCLHTIEHLPDLGRFFSELARVLRPGGIAIVVYPWEPFRGFQAIAAAVRQHGNPLMARRIHLHRLTPQVVTGLVKGTALAHVESKLVFARGIQYLTRLEKTSGS